MHNRVMIVLAVLFVLACGQMSCIWTDEPACKRVRVSNLLNCANRLDEAALPDLDMALAASDLLDQFQDRGMDDVIHRKIYFWV
jgi:hypothetical protein